MSADANGVICTTTRGQVVFTGAYVITGSRGKYASAFGSGIISWAITAPTVGGINNELFLTGSFAP